jgi:hypothetical protein
MLFPILVAFLIIASIGGWFCARLKRRRRRLSATWLLLPVFPYAVFGLIGAFATIRDGDPWQPAFGWWLIGFGYVGLPMLVWAGAAAVGFSVGLLRDNAEAK